jgi:hypothetical protein
MSQKADLNQEIALEAYYLYVERRSHDGNDLDDWLRAEAIVMERRTKAEPEVDGRSYKKTTAKSRVK